MTVELPELNQPHSGRVQEPIGKMVELIDRNEPGGWMVRASVLGGLVQTFYVYELDEKKAAAMARTAIAARGGESVDAVRLLNIHELEDHGVKPGEVKQFI